MKSLSQIYKNNINSTLKFSSTLFITLSKNSNKRVKVELPFRNPCCESLMSGLFSRYLRT